MRLAAIVLIVVFLFSLCLSCLVGPASVSQELTFLSAELSPGTLYSEITGTVQLPEDLPEGVDIDATVLFYDDEGKLIWEQPIEMWLVPGQMRPFEVNPGILAESYDIRTSGPVQVLNSKMVLRSGGTTPEVHGEVENSGSASLDEAEVVAKFYNAEGIVISQGTDSLRPLEPGETTRFRVQCFSEDIPMTYELFWKPSAFSQRRSADYA